ncbi:MAG: PEGA domain-containing protein [Bacteroidetes bacterium]|nr:PEGA domain-containing protein [Bacteroidota bacterium]MBU1114295.1 PEGA domain-containing protein [Bacteroidota bacterium]MBU1799410.1 PEGA domain-containing protein [Bacteroidota bacterium]
MKYLSRVLLILTLVLVAVACEDNTVEPVANGSLVLSSTPAGALISIDGVSTEQVTPATVEAQAGIRDVTLSLVNYRDTTFSVSVTAGEQGVVSVVLKPTATDVTISSTPVGAEIWINGSNSGFVTPQVFTDMPYGNYTITLKKENFEDYTQVLVVSSSSTSLDVDLAPLYATYTTIRLWETVGTTSTQPSGLDLSTGEALSISSSSGVNGNVDIYYYSSSDGSNYIVRSAKGENGMTRETYFKVAAGSDLTDGVDSPVKDANWATQIGDRESSYVFLYDADGNYSKLKIVNYGGGNPGDPAWVDVSWTYNKAVGSTKF